MSDDQVPSGGRLLIALLVTEICDRPAPEFSYAARLRPSHWNPYRRQGNDDFTYVAQVVSHIARRQRDAPLDSAFMSCIRRVAASIHLLLSLCWFSAEWQRQRRRHHRRTHTRDVSEISTFWCHRRTARIEPGDAGETRPPPRIVA